jgi:hypothetical protein
MSRMLFNCTANMPGSLEIPSIYPSGYGKYNPVKVTIGLVINNFISVDDETAQVTVSQYLDRSSILFTSLPPEVWQNINPQSSIDGLDITQYVFNEANPLPIWLPDIFFSKLLKQKR